MDTVSECKGSDEIPNHDCDVCFTNGKTSEAISYCTVCSEYLCQSCDMAHGTFKATKDHIVLKGTSIPSLKTEPTLPCMYCDTHKSTLLSLYCVSHDRVICPACKIMSHAQCETGDVRSHSSRTDVAKEIKGVSKRFKDLRVRYEKLVTNRKIDKSSLKAQVLNSIADLLKFRKDLNNRLDHLEQNSSSEIRQLEGAIQTEIDSHVTLADDVLHEMEDLDKCLSDSQKLQDSEAQFVGTKKVSARALEFERMINRIEKDVYPIDIRFRSTGVLSDMVLQLESLGSVTSKPPDQTSQASVLNISLMEKPMLKMKANYVSNTFMSGGDFVVACGDEGLKVFDKDFQFRYELLVYSIDVASVDHNDVIITQGKYKKLHRVSIFPKMAVKKTLKMDCKCDAVNVCKDEIYVLCQCESGNADIRVLGMDGSVKRRLGKVNGNFIFSMPNEIQVNADGSRVFVSDMETHVVTCMDRQGHVIYQYSDKDLKAPTGLCVDNDDNLLVCGLRSHNVHVIRKNGVKEMLLFHKTEGIQYPACISYRQSDGCLVLGLDSKHNNGKQWLVYETR